MAAGAAIGNWLSLFIFLRQPAKEPYAYKYRSQERITFIARRRPVYRARDDSTDAVGTRRRDACQTESEEHTH